MLLRERPGARCHRLGSEGGEAPETGSIKGPVTVLSPLGEGDTSSSNRSLLLNAHECLLRHHPNGTSACDSPCVCLGFPSQSHDHRGARSLAVRSECAMLSRPRRCCRATGRSESRRVERSHRTLHHQAGHLCSGIRLFTGWGAIGSGWYWRNRRSLRSVTPGQPAMGEPLLPDPRFPVGELPKVT